MNTPRLKSQARCRSILDAVKKVFAERGARGATTRELARAAGVSEALMFRHYPTKERLFAAVQEDCIKGPILAEYRRVMALEPSTSTLVLLVHFLSVALIQSTDPDKRVLDRLVLRDLLEDGRFAKSIQDRYLTSIVSKLGECLRAAVRAGDAEDIPVRADLRAVFVHHLFYAVQMFSMPPIDVMAYKASKAELASQAVWFSLLGFGLKPAAIRRYYNPKALALLAA